MTRPVHLASLVVGDWVVARAERALEAEYALFAASDVLLTAKAALGTRERGYLTTAGIARARLADAGVTIDLANAALAALGPLRELARTPAIARVCDRLGAGEAFQGAWFDAESRRYRGAWIDLDAIARACDGADIALAMQLVHLAAVLDDVDANVPVRLLTAGDESRAGERSWRKVDLDFVRDLPDALALAHRPFDASMIDASEIDADIVADLHARAAMSPRERPRLYALASLLGGARPDVELIVTDELEVRLEPLLVELHTHRAMLLGEAHLREVAQFFTAMSEKRSSLCDLAILASRAWLASGEIAYARYFARRVTDDVTATLAARAAATEILESTTPTNESMRPPPVMENAPEPPSIVTSAPLANAPRGASLPPMAPSSSLPPVALLTTATSEIIETMPAPDDDMRARMTKIAREVARDYRLAYGITLKTDGAAVEAMQRHLRRRFADARSDERLRSMLVTELTRHGALLSEILARALGATWTDTDPVELGHWEMLVPPGTLIHPIGRVYRFFQQDHREDDLIAYYTLLETNARARISSRPKSQ
jgi:hypothetical protein